MVKKRKAVCSRRTKRVCKASNRYKCNRRSRSQLSKQELRRVDSALEASANLCESISRNIYQSDSEEGIYERHRVRCRSRSLGQLSRWELERVDSALNAAANLCDSTSRDIFASDSESDLLVCSRLSLVHKPFTCRCLAMTLTLLQYLQKKDSEDCETGR